ncbi:hypothetical protein MCOR25_009840 [Pyricularia grisea]|nr:hypothetical protein MCOR25_009840 [Pyricularia grisea]
MDSEYLPKWLNDAGAVFSKNGEHPVNYPGWHQTDIVRIKAVERLKQLSKDQDKPLFYWISLTAPHTVPPVNGPSDNMPQPRHKDLFPDLVLPKKGNWNPSDEYAKQKVNWVGRTAPLNESMLAETELLYKTRIKSLQGIDEIIEDVVATLE